MFRKVVSGLLLLTSAACVPKSGRLEANRFQHDRYPYAVFYAEPGHPSAPFGSSWRVENFAKLAGGRHEPKTGTEYTVARTYDLDDDGRVDFERVEPIYDLWLTHTRKPASMWVRTLPLAELEMQSDLRLLAERYVAAMDTSGTLTPEFGPESTRVAELRRDGVRIEQEFSCTLSERPAQRIDVTLDHGSTQASVVLVKTGYVERVYDGASGSGRYPVLLVAALSAPATDYAALEPEFDRLLRLTVLGDEGQGLSMQGAHTCGAGGKVPGSGGETPLVTGESL